jgi:hypothetical protein
MKKIFLAFALLALSGFPQDSPKRYANPHKPATQPASPDPLALERWFVGDWICTGIQHSSQTASGVRFTDRFHFRMALGGSWQIYNLHQVEGPHKGQLTLIGAITWDANVRQHVRRDMNIGGSRMDMTTPGWDGDTMVSTGYMVRNDQKLPAKQSFLKKGDDRYDSSLEIAGADGKPVDWEEEACRRIR